jgi:putative nucleotidyltransferase with HDIG domain
MGKPEMNHIDRILRSVDYLPPFPVVVTKAFNLMRDPDVSLNEIAELISTDQAIVANLLRFCNCSFIALQKPIKTVRDAVVFVGLNHLRKMLMVTGARTFYKAYHQGFEMRAAELWHHSLAASLLSSRLEKACPGADPDFAFIAALLHDVGKIVLHEFFENEQERMHVMIEFEHCTPIQAEERVLGIDHAQIGFRILSLWQFPEDILEAISIHHKPGRSADSPLANIVRLANSMANIMGYGNDADGLERERCEDVCRMCGFDTGMIDSISTEIREELDRVVSEFGFTTQNRQSA